MLFISEEVRDEDALRSAVVGDWHEDLHVVKVVLAARTTAFRV